MADSINPGDRMLLIYGMEDLTPTEKNVLAVVAYCDGPGGCKPSLDWLAEKLTMNRYTVSLHLKRIKEKGRITWKSGQRGNIYTIFYPVSAVGNSRTVKNQSAVGDSPTVEKNPGVGDSPNPGVGDSPTQRESIRESITPLTPQRKKKRPTQEETAEGVRAFLAEGKNGNNLLTTHED